MHDSFSGFRVFRVFRGWTLFADMNRSVAEPAGSRPRRAGAQFQIEDPWLGVPEPGRSACSRRVVRREETERFEDRKMGRPPPEIIFLSLIFLSMLFCGCSSADRATQETISVGMRRAETMRRLTESGAVEVTKDVAQDARGWSIAGRSDCLFLRFTNDVLASIGVELNADKPKMYRGGYETNSYRLR
jgi:hypothetical protein